MKDVVDPLSLRALYGDISPLAQRKILPRLDQHCRAFIALSPFVVLASGDRDGQMDASPRGDAPGFVLILDDQRILLPDRPGNNRVDTFSNLVANSGVGLLFFVPGIDETLRVNGVATIVTDADRLGPTSVRGRLPKAGLLITVAEAFFHCGKALKRARLWRSEAHVDRNSFPSLGRIMAEQTGHCSAEEAEVRIASDYQDKLY
jgi:PPOX class probable FMN-dependent enzyme